MRCAMSAAVQELDIAGKGFVVVERSYFERTRARAGEIIEDNLPPLPKPSTDGTYPALAYARASIARSLVRERRGASLSQQQLARLAGVRQETISRIESGKHTATVRIIDKLHRAVQRAGRLAARREV